MYDLLIEEYLERVTRDMGPVQKREVEEELRTHILDGAEALAAERKTAVDEAIIREVISDMMPAAQLSRLYPRLGPFLQIKRLRNAIKGLAFIATMFLLVAGILWLVSPDTLNTFPAIVILSIVGTIVLLFIVFTIIFAWMYLYDTSLKVPYEARLKPLKERLNYRGSPWRVLIVIFCTVVWLIFLSRFWSVVPFPTRFGMYAQLIPLLSQDFAVFVPWFILLGIMTIAIQLLSLVVRQKWLYMLFKAVQAACNAMLHLWLLSSFPFNHELSAGIQSGIKVLLAVLIMLSIISATAMLWKAARQFRMNRAAKRKEGTANDLI